MSLEDLNPKSRFNNLAEDYLKYRPHYPKEIIEFLKSEFNLSKKHIIADIGSGTGISSKLFLDNGNEVYGIEPNEKMRLQGEQYLTNCLNFHSIDASSENTKLKSNSIDIITVGQAFHWFDPIPTKNEFLRILKPDGLVIILSNKRKLSNNSFMRGYMELMSKYSKPFTENSLNMDFSSFFAPHKLKTKVFPNSRVYNWEYLKGDLISYSYVPHKGDDDFDDMISDLESLFNKHNNNGTVHFDYETVIYYSNIS